MRLFTLSLFFGAVVSFVPSCVNKASPFVSRTTRLFAEDEQDTTADAEGADLAAELFKLAKERNIELDEDDEDWDDEEDLDDDEAKELNLTDNQIDKEVKERVLETAGGFVEYVKPPSEDEEGDDETKEEEEKKPKQYKAPTKVPDDELTAGEVVELILDALAHNDVPTKNKGVEILFGYSSSNSQVKQMDDLTPAEYGDYLKENDYKVVFENQGVRIDKGEYSADGSKAFYTARIQVGPKESVPVNFILSTGGSEDTDAWLVDSMLIRPPSMRRNRRR